MDHFQYRSKQLHAENVSLAEIAKAVGTPFYCYSTATLERHYRVLDEAFAGLPHRICYATKANGNLAVVRTLAKLGSGADVVSEGEIRLALAAGIPASKIVFSGVGKTREEMAYALKQGVFQFNVESVPEMHALHEVALAMDAVAPIAIRVNPDVDAFTHAKISTGKKENKFGIDLDVALEAFRTASKLSGLKIQGISVHIGSQLTTLKPFEEAFRRLVEFAGVLKSEGFAITQLDFGGGLGVPYGKEEPPLPLAYADIVRQAVRGMNCEITLEPGRLLVANAGILVARVIYVKESATKRFLILDAGMNDLLRPALYEAHHAIVPLEEIDANAPEVPYDIVGPVCETGDTFAKDRMLPLMKAGDLVAFRTAGAYGSVMASTYNARPLVPEVMVKDASFAVTRPRQSYDDLIRDYALPAWLS